jgi:hypothetical protein
MNIFKDCDAKLYQSSDYIGINKQDKMIINMFNRIIFISIVVVAICVLLLFLICVIK